MVDGIGLSVGATNLTAVVVGRAAVTRSAVVTLLPGRPLEVGVPAENPRLTSDERGVVITDFVDRVGDPVGIIAPDGSTHRGEVLLAQALRALLYEVTNGRGTADPVAVTYPAHWQPAAVEALRGALAPMREFAAAVLVSDAVAAVRAMHDDPGLPASGVVALCDFGGSGSSITLVDLGSGEPAGQTVRHTELSGDLVDQAVMSTVLGSLSDAGAVDTAGTAAIGPLSRLRAQCRAAKERLSTAAATSLFAELPGHRGEVRLTRDELDESIRPALTEFARVLRETLNRSGVAGLAAVASVGGGARIPLITTTLSEHFGVPVVTVAHPELAAAIGGGLTAVRGAADVGATAMAEALSPPTAAAAAVAATQMAPEIPDDMGSSSSSLAWSEADDVPDVVPVTDSYDYAPGASTDAMGGPRPSLVFDPETEHYEPEARRPIGLLIAGLVLLLLAIAFAVWFVLRSDESTPSPSSTSTRTTTTTESAPAPTSEAPTGEAPPPPPVTETVTRAPQTVTQAPSAPPTSEAPPPPPPSSEPPPPTTTEPPPSSQSTPPRIIPTLPYTTIPGLPFVPAPIQPAP